MNPGTVTSIRYSRGSLALITFLGDWKLEEMGLYPRMTWAINFLSVTTKVKTRLDTKVKKY